MLSDSDSSDSDNGIRFKTASTRNKDGSYGGSGTGSSMNNHSSSKHYSDRSDGNWRHSTSSRTSDHRYSPDKKKYERRSSDTSRRRRSESYERRRNRSRSKDKYSYSNSNNRVYDRKRSRSKEYHHHHHHHYPHQHQHHHQQQQRNDNNNNDNIKDVSNKSDNVKTISPKSINIATEKLLDKQHKSKKSKHKKHKKSKREEKPIDKSLKIKSVEKDVVATVTVPIIETTSNDSKFITEKPVSLLESINLEQINDKNDSNTVCGPSLPPNFKTRSSSRSSSSKTPPPSRLLSTIITTKTATNYSTTSCSSTSTIIPHNDDQIEHLMSDISDDSESDDFNLIGPLPPGLTSNSESVLQLEKRALEIKLAKLNYDNNDEHSILQQHREREEWMTELPDIKSVADFGVTARQFRVKERPDFGDRTSWTDTPNDKLRKQSHKINSSSGNSKNGRSNSSTTCINNSENDKQIKYSHEELRLIKQKEANALFNAKRDAEQEKAARQHKHKHKHKRDESLLDIHRKKLKIRKEESDKKSKRRPFCRETDLKVNQFDQKQKNSIIKKAQLLDSRFGCGESKYL